MVGKPSDGDTADVSRTNSLLFFRNWIETKNPKVVVGTMSLPQQEEDVTRSMNDTTMPPPPPARKSKTTRATTGSSSGSTKTSKNPRRKYGMRKGFGMQDWNRLVKSAKNLAQRDGGLRRITRDEVRQHNTEHDGWTILHGKVYNIAPYLHYHPGGLKILKQCLGRDATALFEKYHRWVNADGCVSNTI